MSRWSESVYSEPNTARGAHSGFLSQVDACLYEGVPMDDPVLDAESREWATRFVHLRIVGMKCCIHTSPSPNEKASVLVRSLVLPEVDVRQTSEKIGFSKKKMSPLKNKTKQVKSVTPIKLPKLSELKIK